MPQGEAVFADVSVGGADAVTLPVTVCGNAINGGRSHLTFKASPHRIVVHWVFPSIDWCQVVSLDDRAAPVAPAGRALFRFQP